MLKTWITKISWWNPLHLKYSSSRFAHFIFHQKAPSPKISTTHKFASRVDQFHYLWHVNLSQQSHGTKKIIISIGFQIGLCGVFGLVLMSCNFGGWFLVGRTIFGLIFLVISSNFLLPIVKGHSLLWVDLWLL